MQNLHQPTTDIFIDEIKMSDGQTSNQYQEILIDFFPEILNEDYNFW